MATLTLTDFLLVRIAEDEAQVQDWPVEGHWGKFDDDRMWEDPRGHPIYAPRARVLAECEAKRRIVAELAAFVPPDGYFAQAQRILGALAAIYADHPDYREEWRV